MREPVMSAAEIQEVLPHRYPFLLVDYIEELLPGQRAVGIKNVSLNEPYFQGHFPGRPLMPGVLIIEALAQVGAVAVLTQPENRGKIGLFAGIDRARFRKPVLPGHVLRLEVELIAKRGSLGKGRGRALVDGEVAAEAEITFALVDRESL